MPPNTLLCAYLDDRERRTFVDASSEVKVKRGEVIMRQGEDTIGQKRAACVYTGVGGAQAQGEWMLPWLEWLKLGSMLTRSVWRSAAGGERACALTSEDVDL